MLKKRGSNKGFTLVELIIAMAIFSVVIFMGYRIINGTNKASANQMKITKEQQNANLMNKYLTNDLESAKSIKEFGLDNDGNIKQSNRSKVVSYGYDIKTIENRAEKNIRYQVNIDESSNKYSIIRQDGNTYIDIVSNQAYNTLESKLPLIIAKDEDLYHISSFNGSNKYDFNVNTRIKADKGNVTPPDGGGTEGNAIGNIVVDKTSNSVDVSMNDTISENSYKPRIVTKKYDNQRKVFLSFKSEELSYQLTFTEGLIKGNINGQDIELDNDGIKNINDTTFKFDFRSNKRDMKIYIDNNEIIYIDTDGSSEVEISLFDNTRDEIDIEIEGDEVSLDFGDDDFNKKAKSSDTNKEIEVELARYMVEDVKSIDIKAIDKDDNDKEQNIDTKFNLNGDGKGYVKEIKDINPNNYYDDYELNLEMDVSDVVEGSSLIINFNEEKTCGVQFEGRKEHENSKDVVLNTIPCEHLKEEEELINFGSHNLKPYEVILDFNEGKIKIYEEANSKGYETAIHVPHIIPNNILANGISIDVNNGIAKITDIHINPGEGKSIYKIEW